MGIYISKINGSISFASLKDKNNFIEALHGTDKFFDCNSISDMFFNVGHCYERDACNYDIGSPGKVIYCSVDLCRYISDLFMRYHINGTFELNILDDSGNEWSASCSRNKEFEKTGKEIVYCKDCKFLQDSEYGDLICTHPKPLASVEPYSYCCRGINKYEAVTRTNCFGDR